VVEVESTEAIKERVVAGEGVAVLPESSVRAELSSGLLVSRQLAGFDPHRSVTLLYPREARLSAATHAFIALAHGMVQDGLLGSPPAG
jgi:DNA-binding transcriptional LysR family regulator